jgi:AhpD family alkylhydroperoxidase
MIIQRINYHQRNPGAINALASANKHITSIDKKLRALIELRVSQINGCAYCVDLHSQQARAEGEDQQRIDCLQQHYSEQQIVDMTLVISTMNMWNRIAIGMRRLPDRRA